MDNTTEKTARKYLRQLRSILNKYSLDDLEKNPDLLVVIPEAQRADFIKRQRAFLQYKEELLAERERFLNKLGEYKKATADLDAIWMNVEKQAREKYGFSEEEYNQILAENPELYDISIGDFMRQSVDDNNELLIGGLLDTILQKAREENKSVNEVIQDIRDALKRGETPNITIRRPESVEYPIDKINSKVWNLLKEDTGGQITFAAEKKGSAQQLDILYSINFDNLEETGISITKKISPIDKRIYIAAAALYNAGNEVMSLRQIHYAMGNTTRPASDQLQKILNSIKKMKAADITVDNTSEAAVYKNYGVFKYNGSLFPAEFFEGYSVQGGLTDAAIHLFREPPLISFSKNRKQITTVPIKVLQSPLNKTEAHLAIDDYLIERIARIKGPNPEKHKKHGSGRILYKTICEHARITGKQKQRLPGTVARYLEHYISCGMITKYTQAADGITIYF